MFPTQAYRACVYVVGGGYITRIFDTQANAEAWIGNMVGQGGTQYGNVTIGLLESDATGAIVWRFTYAEQQHSKPIGLGN